MYVEDWNISVEFEPGFKVRPVVTVLLLHEWKKCKRLITIVVLLISRELSRPLI